MLMKLTQEENKFWALVLLIRGMSFVEKLCKCYKYYILDLRCISWVSSISTVSNAGLHVESLTEKTELQLRKETDKETLTNINANISCDKMP